MEQERRRQRRRITAVAEEEPRSVHDVPDELLRLILLLLDSPIWLVRAACACRRWRRAVADGGRAFLRLAGSFHLPAVVGHYHVRSCRPFAFVSSPALPINGGRFSLDFIPAIKDWMVADYHGGLVLLRKLGGSLANLIIVCDPLTRRYQGTRHPSEKQLDQAYAAGAFLLDGEDGGISISNFRVLHCFHQGLRASVFVFVSTADGAGWRFLRQSTDAGDCCGHVAGRVDGSIYLGLATGKVKILDKSSLEFSDVDLPIRIDRSKLPSGSAFTVVHGAGPNPTSPPTTWIIHVHGDALEFFRLVRGGGAWVLEHSIPQLSEATRGLPGCHKVLKWRAVDVIAGGTGIAVVSARAGYKRGWLFSVDMGTKELQVVPEDRIKAYHRTTRTFTYMLPWPRSVLACLPP
ncbi:hypothetical protein PAHAL_3G497100 [Panicum hallii]|jgi:hypothetical protein|uniref:F-box domain-containing protein n=1 Tax=Panicum hallii TaxID=206008 RepID=A0A2T8KM18_9POAL|nr:hypothetical protein PAHAL_3G497100 [Panicum hallii]